MAPKKGNKIVQINLPKFHRDKLNLISVRTGLTNSGIVQRMIEDYKLFEIADENKEALEE